MTVRARRGVLGAWLVRALVVIAAVLVARLLRDVYLARDVVPALEGNIGVRYWEIARTSFARGDGFPLLDRSQCGSWPYLANPDTPVLSALVAGIFRIHGDVMSRWMITLHLVIALVGTYAWARRALELGRIASFFAGALFVSSGWVAFELQYRSHFLPVSLLPWVLLFARMGEHDRRAAVLAGIALAGIVLEGGMLWPLGFTLVALVLAELPRVFRREGGAQRVFASLGITLVTFFGVSAVKLVPAVVALSRYPRLFKENDQMSWGQIATILGENDLLRALGTAYHRDEYRAYVGALAVGMAIAGAGTAIILKPRRIEVALLAVFGLLIARGAFAPAAPYVLLSKLPLFSQLNVPGRFMGLAVFGMAAAGAVAVDAAIRAVKSRTLAAIVVGVAVLAVYDPLSVSRKTQTLYPPDPFLPRPDPQPAASYHLLAIDDLVRKSQNPERNIGSPSCYKLGLAFPEATGLAIGPVDQATVDPAAGSVKAVVRQNGTELDVNLRRPGVVRLNQSFDRDLHASVGELHRSSSGATELALPAGAQKVIVRYRPQGFFVGLVATILALLGAAAAFAMPWIRKRSASAR